MFEQVPELYDRARPVYPPDVFDDIVTLAGLGEGARVLEIGCGTGQATLPLAERGFEVTCIELGEQLAAVARRKLAPFANVKIVNANFETWESVGERFDAVVAFTAFHWLDPNVRYEKTAGVLDDGGALSIVDTRHVWPEGGDPFWAEVQEDYDAIAPDPNNEAPPRPDAVGELSAEIQSSGRFGTSRCGATSGTSPTARTSTSPSSTRIQGIARSTTTRVSSCMTESAVASRRDRAAPLPRHT